LSKKALNDSKLNTNSELRKEEIRTQQNQHRNAAKLTRNKHAGRNKKVNQMYKYANKRSLPKKYEIEQCYTIPLILGILITLTLPCNFFDDDARCEG